MEGLSEESEPEEFELQQEKTESSWEHEDLAHVRIKVLRGHSETVRSCEYFNENNLLLSSSYDGKCHVWNTKTGEVHAVYDGHNGKRVSEANCNPDEDKFVSCGWDKAVNIWDIATQKVLWTGHCAGITTCAKFSTDGQKIVVGSDLDYTITLWDTRTGKKESTLRGVHVSTPTSVRFNPRDDRILSTSLDGTTKVYDLLSQQVTISLKDHTNVVSSCDITKDERYMATTSWDKTLYIYDVSTGMYRSQGARNFNQGHEGCVSCCRFNTTGNLLVSGAYDCSVVMWEVASGARELKLCGHDDWVEDVTFSSDSNWLASASRDCTIRLWHIEHSEELPVVMEQKITAGVRVVHCVECSKPFSLSDVEARSGQPKCVFCRMADPERYKSDIAKTMLQLSES